MADHLALGALIVDYLKLHLPDSPVQQLTDLGAIDQVAVRGHLICIAYAGETVESTAALGRTVVITQRWLVIVSVQTAGRALDGAAPAAKAGPLLDRAGKLLQGQQFEGYKPLQRTTPPAPRQAGGFAHFPLAFVAEIAVTGEGQPIQ